MNINFNKIITFIIPLLSIFTISLFISNLFFILLPYNGVEYDESINDGKIYRKYEVINSFKLNKKEELKNPKVVVEESYLLTNEIKLQAIYLLSENDGFVIIYDKSTNMSYTLSINEKFKEYKLSKIYSKYILLTKDGKTYSLFMNKKNDDNDLLLDNLDNNIENENINKPEIIKNNDNSFNLKKTDVLSYSKNLKKIWNDIGIKTSRINGKIVGFQVYKINKNSVFADLGLKKGDILTKANNIVLENYQNAFKVYNMIDKTDILKLTILRGDKNMEIEYEIK